MREEVAGATGIVILTEDCRTDDAIGKYNPRPEHLLRCTQPRQAATGGDQEGGAVASGEGVREGCQAWRVIRIFIVE